MTPTYSQPNFGTSSAFNRPRIAAAVTDESEALRIAEFEHVAADSSVTLLRVSGTLAPTPQASAQRPTLIAEHGGGRQRFPALPSPPDPPGVLRAAYSVPAAVVAPATSYTLELDDGSW